MDDFEHGLTITIPPRFQGKSFRAAAGRVLICSTPVWPSPFLRYSEAVSPPEILPDRG